MQKYLTYLLCGLAFLLGHISRAELETYWSTGMAVPGESVMLYIVDTDCGQDFFEIAGQIKVERSSTRPLDPQLVRNNSSSGIAEVIPVLFVPDSPGIIQPEEIELLYKSGKRSKVKVTPLEVRPTSEIRWLDTPLRYGALWYSTNNEPYANEAVQLKLKLFLPEDCFARDAPRLNSLGAKIGSFERPIGGIIQLVQQQIMPQTKARASGKAWVTEDFEAEIIPFRDGRSELTGSILVGQRSFMQISTGDLALPPTHVSALPLPPGAPAHYDSLSGEFQIESKTTAKDLAMHEAVDVEITVRGSGNLSLMECPKPVDAEGWKLVPATKKPLVNAKGQVIGMVFSQLMRPSMEVDAIPSFRLSYFSPKELDYDTVSTRPIPLPWRSSDEHSAALSATVVAEPPPAGTVPVAEMTDIYGILPHEVSSDFFSIPLYFWTLLYLPSLVIVLMLSLRALRRYRESGAGQRELEQALNQVKKQQDAQAFLKAAGAFIESHVPASAQDTQMRAILSRRDEELFRPEVECSISPHERRQMLSTLRRALSHLSKLSILILALLGTQLHASILEQAHKEYEGAQYTKALEQYKQALDESPERLFAHGKENEAALLYHMGNCEYRLKQSGLAALNYARALQLSPRFAEARANLEFIQRKEGAIVANTEELDQVFTFLSERNIAVLSIISSAILLLILCLLPLWRKQGKGWLYLLTALNALLCLALAVNWLYYLTREQVPLASIPAQDVAYVIRSTEGRSSADAQGASLIRIPVASPLQVLARRSTWVYVRCMNNTRAWVLAEDIETLTPRPQ